MRDSRADTRHRLVETAAPLFAERGFRRVTVREICSRAGANIAAVNYHFGGKMGLYRAVQELAIEAVRRADEAARRAGEKENVERRLETYLRAQLAHVAAGGANGLLPALIARELADPTPGLDAIIDRAVRPRTEFLCRLVGELLRRRPDDERVRDCVASIQAQCLLALPGAIGTYLRPHRPRAAAADLARLASHISAFTLAALDRLAHRPARHSSRSRRRRSRQE